ncbi:RNA polymerase II-associated protein 3 [Papilio xuthus]|uniref:RNA polymerase II-associated protein 3 n=1 Tax=Papilio xuthus TaxID=66420 RepID=A0A194QGQ2_PAPXU|nr:RNA polymerase II-associated protein 3 [Papilio xuthus]
MQKAFEIQKSVRDNAKTFQTYLTDLQTWETEMKRKEAALNGDFVKDLPPVRSKIKRERPVEVKKKPEKRIAASDYQAWEKFDVEKACEEVDMAEIGPVSLDSKKSEKDKQEKLREEAQYEKERGNAFVKEEKWDEAIKCYNRAIELIKDDAIYYANRGLCYLKKDSLHQAVADCTAALNIDPTYVKALQRRATARERLGSLRAATADLTEVISLEPRNTAAKKQLEAIKIRMGTKGSKSKSSPNAEQNNCPKTPKIVELGNRPTLDTTPAKTALEKWKTGEGEDINVMKPVKKPPHLRSKRALKTITIEEIPLGKKCSEKPATRMKIIEIDNQAQGDSNTIDSNKTKVTKVSGKTNDKIGDGDSNITPESIKIKDENVKDKVENEDNIIAESLKINDLKVKDKIGDGDSNVTPESLKLIIDEVTSEKECIRDLVPPVNSVQFMAEWKNLKGNNTARSKYMSIIEPTKIPSIFENALESDVLSEILQILSQDMEVFSEKTVTAYLKGLVRVKRFSALAMFLSTTDKQCLNKLLEHCKNVEKSAEEDILDLKNKFEL